MSLSLRLTAPLNGSSSFATATTLSGSRSLAFTYKLVSQNQGSPTDYQTGLIGLNHTAQNAESTGFEVQFLTDGIQILLNGAAVADNGFSHGLVVGTTYNVIITWNTTIVVKVNGVTEISYASGAIGAGYVAFFANDCKILVDSFDDTRRDNWYQYASGWVAGNPTVEILAPVNARYVASTVAGSFGVTGRNPSLKYPRKFVVSSGNFGLTGNSPALRHGYQLNTAKGTFGVTANAAALTYASATNRYLKTSAADGGQASVVSTSSFSATTRSVTIDVTLLQQVAATPLDYHGPSIWLNTNGNTLTTGYRLEILTDGIKLIKDGTSVADDGFSNTQSINSTNTFFLGCDGTNVTVKKNGTTILTYPDASVAAGNIALTTLSSIVKWDNINGTISDNFNSRTIGTYAVADVIGAFTVAGLGGGSVSINSNTTAYSLSTVAGSFGVTANAAVLKATRTLPTVSGIFSFVGQSAALRKGYTMYPTSGMYTFSGYGPVVKLNRGLTTVSGQFAYAGPTPVITYTPKTQGSKVMNVTAGVFGVNTPVPPTSIRSIGRSRAATMAMFQSQHIRTQSELRKQLASTLPLNPPLKTLQKPVKPAGKALAVQRNRLLSTRPALVVPKTQNTVARPQYPRYNDHTDSPDDEDALLSILQHY